MKPKNLSIEERQAIIDSFDDLIILVACISVYLLLCSHQLIRFLLFYVTMHVESVRERSEVKEFEVRKKLQW